MATTIFKLTNASSKLVKLSSNFDSSKALMLSIYLDFSRNQDKRKQFVFLVVSDFLLQTSLNPKSAFSQVIIQFLTNFSDDSLNEWLLMNYPQNGSTHLPRLPFLLLGLF
jgi:hypothetical protein